MIAMTDRNIGTGSEMSGVRASMANPAVINSVRVMKKLRHCKVTENPLKSPYSHYDLSITGSFNSRIFQICLVYNQIYNTFADADRIADPRQLRKRSIDLTDAGPG